MVTNGIFQTSSLNIVAWLSANDIEFMDHVVIYGKSTFYFERTEQLSKCLDEYNTNEQLKKFISSYKRIRSIVKS